MDSPGGHDTASRPNLIAASQPRPLMSRWSNPKVVIAFQREPPAALSVTVVPQCTRGQLNSNGSSCACGRNDKKTRELGKRYAELRQ